MEVTRVGMGYSYYTYNSVTAVENIDKEKYIVACKPKKSSRDISLLTSLIDRYNIYSK